MYTLVVRANSRDEATSIANEICEEHEVSPSLDVDRWFIQAYPKSAENPYGAAAFEAALNYLLNDPRHELVWWNRTNREVN